MPATERRPGVKQCDGYHFPRAGGGHRFFLKGEEMAHRYKLRKRNEELIRQVKLALELERDDHREAWGDASERWQEGDRGVAVDEWIATFDDLINALNEFEEQPEGL